MNSLQRGEISGKKRVSSLQPRMNQLGGASHQEERQPGSPASTNTSPVSQRKLGSPGRALTMKGKDFPREELGLWAFTFPPGN